MASIFTNKVCLITGAASGIGLALSIRASKYNMILILVDVDKLGLAQAAAKSQKAGAIEVLEIVSDLSVRGSMKDVHRKVYSKYGIVHFVFLNAGRLGPLKNLATEVHEEELESFLNLNFLSVLDGLRLFAASMHSGGEKGHIISTASIYGILPSLNAYGMTKQCVVSITEAYQSALMSLNSKTQCSVLCPSFVSTNLHNSTGKLEEAIFQKKLLGNLIQHGSSPEEVAEITFKGIEEGRTYIHTHKEISSLLAKDKYDSVIMHERLSFTNHDEVLLNLMKEVRDSSKRSRI